MKIYDTPIGNLDGDSPYAMRSRYYKPIATAKGNDLNGLQTNRDRQLPDYTKWDSSVLLFGCSTTAGYQLQDKEKLHNVLKTRRQVINFGYPAESNFHFWMKLIDQVKEHRWPYMVVMGWTTFFRIGDFKQPDYIDKIGPWLNKPYSDFIQRNELNLIEYSKLVMDSVEIMCKGKTKLFQWSWFDLNETEHNDEWQKRFKNMKLNQIDFTEDGGHPGPKSIQSLARKIENEL